MSRMCTFIIISHIIIIVVCYVIVYSFISCFVRHPQKGDPERGIRKEIHIQVT